MKPINIALASLDHRDLNWLLHIETTQRLSDRRSLRSDKRPAFRTTRDYEQIALVPLADIATPLSLRARYQPPPT